MSPEKQALLDRLNAERYGPSAWWAKPAPSDAPDTILQRQLLLAEVADDEVVA